MSNEPRYPDLNEKSLGEQVAELKDYIVNLHRYIRYADNNIAERNLTRTLEDKINSYVDADGVIHILDELGFDSEVGFYNYVTFHNLQTEGETIINGDNITTGTILADYIDVDGIIAANGIVVTDDLKDGSTVISGSNILTGTIDTDRLNVGDIISNGNIVVINDLTDGTTQISGDNITTGTIDAARLNVNDIIASGSIIVQGDDISDLNNDSGFITSGDIPTDLSDFNNDTGFITSGDIPTDLSDFNNDTGFITDAVDSVILVYKSAVSGTSTMAKPNAEVTDTTGSQNTWTTVRPQYSSSYPVLFVCWQTKLVSGTVSWTTPAKDETTTVIDGGHITTGTIDASQVTVTNIDADNIATGTIDASVVNVTNIDADNINTGTLDADLIKSSCDYGSPIGVVTAYFDASYFKIEDDLGDVLLNIGFDPVRDKMYINAGGMGQNGVLEINGVNTSIYGARSLDLSSQQGISIFGEPLEDFVVDEGTSNSWYYRIWYSGRMECWRRFSKTATAINTASGSLYTTSGNTTFDSYPYNFSAAPTVNMSLESAQGLILAVTGTGTVSTPPSIKVMRTAAYTSSTTFYVDVHASGMKASS